MTARPTGRELDLLERAATPKRSGTPRSGAARSAATPHGAADRAPRLEPLRVVQTDAAGAKVLADGLRRRAGRVRLLDARQCRTRTQLVAALGIPARGGEGAGTVVFAHANALLEADEDVVLAALLAEVWAGESGRAAGHRSFVLCGTGPELDALTRRVRAGGGELPRREMGQEPAEPVTAPPARRTGTGHGRGARSGR